MADSDTVQVGDQVIIVGAPYGLELLAERGLDQRALAAQHGVQDHAARRVLPDDATINTGNSGGPMFNMKGEVIGIVSHNISKCGGSEGLGFVVTMNTAKQLLLEKRSFWTGLEGMVLSDELADLLNLPPGSTGFIVKTVAKGSPADAIGLRGSDDDRQHRRAGGAARRRHHPVGRGRQGRGGNLTKIRDMLASKPAGSPFKVTVLRAGQVLELTGKVQ